MEQKVKISYKLAWPTLYLILKPNYYTQEKVNYQVSNEYSQ